MLRELVYQERVLKTLESYLDALKVKKAEADEIAAIAKSKPHLKFMIPDFAKEAWESLQAGAKLPASRTAIEYSPRLDGIGRPRGAAEAGQNRSEKRIRRHFG